jgi:TrmH family RNA methyltransferase
LKSISNNTLTLLRKLNQKKYRYKEKRFLVEGARAVEQILRNKKVQVQEFFFDEAQRYWERPRWSEQAEAHASGQQSSIIPTETYAEVSDTDNPQGVMALCRMPDEADPEQLAGSAGIIVAADAIQDPGNLGTIIRTAGWFGAGGLLSGKGTVDLFHPKVVRSTAGATGSMPHLNGELQKVLVDFEAAGWKVVLLDAGSDSEPLQKVSKGEKMLVVIGNEANGIDASLFNKSRQKARIASPVEQKDGSVESLNAAIALSIALYALT